MRKRLLHARTIAALAALLALAPMAPGTTTVEADENPGFQVASGRVTFRT